MAEAELQARLSTSARTTRDLSHAVSHLCATHAAYTAHSVALAVLLAKRSLTVQLQMAKTAEAAIHRLGGCINEPATPPRSELYVGCYLNHKLLAAHATLYICRLQQRVDHLTTQVPASTMVAVS